MDPSVIMCLLTSSPGRSGGKPGGTRANIGHGTYANLRGSGFKPWISILNRDISTSRSSPPARTHQVLLDRPYYCADSADFL